jgi:hypothetical protein
MPRSYGTQLNFIRFLNRGLKSTATILTVSTRLLHPQNLWVMDRVCNLTQVVPNSKLYFASKNYLSLFLTYYTTPNQR